MFLRAVILKKKYNTIQRNRWLSIPEREYLENNKNRKHQEIINESQKISALHSLEWVFLEAEIYCFKARTSIHMNTIHINLFE